MTTQYLRTSLNYSPSVREFDPSNGLTVITDDGVAVDSTDVPAILLAAAISGVYLDLSDVPFDAPVTRVEWPFVHYELQALTDAQKLQARENIGVSGSGSGDFVPLGQSGGTTVADQSYDVEGSGPVTPVVYVPPVSAGDTAVLFAAKMPGDTYARIVVFADLGQGIFIGDGTIDPTADPTAGSINLFGSNGDLGIATKTGNGLVVYGRIIAQGGRVTCADLTLDSAETHTVGAAGAADALPATPSWYIPITVGDGTEYLMPVYAKP